MASKEPLSGGVAVRDGRIVAVGDRSSLSRLKSSGTRVVELGRRTIVPGFVDPHMHSNFAAQREWLDLSPFTTASLEAALQKIRKAARSSEAGKFIAAKMLDPSLMPGEPFTRAQLDLVAPQNPVFVLESNGHVAYANTLAFERAGVTAATDDPPQGRFIRSETGELTGRMEEPPAFLLVAQAMGSPSQEDLVRFLRADIMDAVARGCTTIHDCGIGGLLADADMALIEATLATGVPIRYAGFLVATHFDRWEELGLTPGERPSGLVLTGIKAWADGSNQGRTGFMREPYLNSESRGALNYTREEITAVVERAVSGKWPLGIHGNGDAAIDVVLDVLEPLAEASQQADLRHRIEHCSILHDEQIARMAELGVSPSFLIGHVHYWGRAFRDQLLGPERAARLDPCASALKGGLRISLHSDYNVTPIDPLRCVQNAVVRDMRDGGEILAPEQCISPWEALRAVTLDAAWQCHLDHECGSLEVGKSADLVVLEEDPLRVPHSEIAQIPIHSSWLRGTMTEIGGD